MKSFSPGIHSSVNTQEKAQLPTKLASRSRTYDVKNSQALLVDGLVGSSESCAGSSPTLKLVCRAAAAAAACAACGKACAKLWGIQYYPNDHLKNRLKSASLHMFRQGNCEVLVIQSWCTQAAMKFKGFQ